MIVSLVVAEVGVNTALTEIIGLPQSCRQKAPTFLGGGGASPGVGGARGARTALGAPHRSAVPAAALHRRRLAPRRLRSRFFFAAPGAMRAFVAAAVLAAAATAETIVELVASDPELSTLYEAIQAANLTETLEGDGPFTVFAPTNDAFDGVDLEAYLAAATGPDELRRLLLFHVVAGEERYEASFIETSTTLETAMGQDIRVNLNPIRLNPTAVDCSKSTECGDLVTRDVAADNGVIHKIDNVVFPDPLPTPSPTAAPTLQTVMELLRGDSDFSTLVAAIEAADLIGERGPGSTRFSFDGDGPYTLFAPTNDAFGDVDVAYYLEAEHQDELVRLLEYHVIAAEVRSGDLSDGQEAENLVPLLLLEAAEPFNVDDPECADSVSFHERNRPSRDCGFVGENLDRCENSKNDDGQIARDACYVT